VRITEKAKKIQERSAEVEAFLTKLDGELSDILDVLLEADESNAVERCKAVYERLDVFYQQM
jgi:uncharacterized protein YqgV (UPF0045/DUF77 family)